MCAAGQVLPAPEASGTPGGSLGPTLEVSSNSNACRVSGLNVGAVGLLHSSHCFVPFDLCTDFVDGLLSDVAFDESCALTSEQQRNIQLQVQSGCLEGTSLHGNYLAWSLLQRHCVPYTACSCVFVCMPARRWDGVPDCRLSLQRSCVWAPAALATLQGCAGSIRRLACQVNCLSSLAATKVSTPGASSRLLLLLQGRMNTLLELACRTALYWLCSFGAST